MSQLYTRDEMTPITVRGIVHNVSNDGKVHIPAPDGGEIVVALVTDGLKRKDWHYDADWAGHGHFIHVSFESLESGLEAILKPWSKQV